jgi:tRNA-dihydrouridine synthase
MNIYSELPRPFFVLAPLDDVTDLVFRQIVAECSKPDIFFTEFVNVDGLQSPGRARLMHKLRVGKSDKPIIAQLWGKKPENYQKTASELMEMGYAGVDINMGCPIKAIVNNGCCSALINDRPLAKEIIEATKAGANGKIPISVKTRLGWSEIDFTWHEFLLGLGLDSLTIHGRTRKEMSLVPADWDSIGHVRELRDKISPTTLIVGNGDVTDVKMGRELASKHRLDGIMIGRGIFTDPFVFSDSSVWADKTPLEKKELFTKHIQLFADTWKNGERKIITLRRFARVYINNFDGAKELREELMNTNSIEELLTLLK